MKRIALIIAGGSGERFWPLSTKLRPKQLLCLTDSGQVMLEEAVRRLEGLFGLENVFVITGPHLVEPIESELPALVGRVLAEPEKRNTAGAIVWGMGMVERLYPDEPLSFAILASDHLIRPVEAFQEKLEQALNTSESHRKLVTIGIVPDRPETGYGYIKKADPLGKHAFLVGDFREKPDLATAQTYLDSGSYLWNSGMFFWMAETFENEFSKAWAAEGDVFGQVLRAVRESGEEAASEFRRLPNLSIDLALMERSSNVAVLESNFEWDDLGAWDALERVFAGDGASNVMRGDVVALDTSGCIVFNNNPDMSVNLLGVENLVVVATEDAILILPKAKAQEVRKLAAYRETSSG